MAWRESTKQAQSAAERRLAGLARDWLPAGGGPQPPQWPVIDPRERGGLALDGWGRPALRGLALLVAGLLAIAAYGVWQGRPRAVAQAPTRIETGVAFATSAEPAPARPAEPSVSAPAAVSASAEPLGEVVVHVVGEVHRPGVVRLPVGSRVEDAVAAAGGVTRRRAADSVNLARVLVDGEQVVVSESGAAGAAPTMGTAAPAVVDLNAASVEALDALPGIGPVIAARITAWRAENGPFRSVDELGEVSGIGDAILGQIRSLVRV